MSRIARSHWVPGVISGLIAITLGFVAINTGPVPGSVVSAFPRVVRPAASLSVNVQDANPGLEFMRGECLSVPAGPVTIQCDDYVVAYPLAPVTRLTQPHQLGLIYNSSLVQSQPVIGVNATLTNFTGVNKVTAKISIGGVTMDSLGVLASTFTSGVPRRIGFTFAHGTTNDIVDYVVEAKMLNSSNGQIGSTQTVTGYFIVVDRRKEFGQGWWVSGYESITDLANDTLLWIGGDGSARAYAEIVGSDTSWVSVTRFRPDTIFLIDSSPDYYMRRAIGGGQVVYDLAGRHRETSDPLGNKIIYRDTTISSQLRLGRIELPMYDASSNVSETAYKFHYSGAEARLDSVRVLGSTSTSWLTYKTTHSTGADPYSRLARITDPESDTVAFRYKNTGGVFTLDTIIGSRADTTRLKYDLTKADTVHIELPTDAITRYDAFSTVGAGTGVNAPEDVSSAIARVDGPRTGAGVFDVWEYHLEGWGAVWRVNNPTSALSLFERDNAGPYAYEGLVTRTGYPLGGGVYRWVYSTYAANGLLETVVDSSLTGSPTTRYTWDTKWSKPTRIISPENDTTTFVYDSNTGVLVKQTLGTDTTKHTTSYTYDMPSGLPILIQPPGYTGSSGDSIGYDARGNAIRSRTPAGVYSYSYKDYAGRDTLLIGLVDTGSALDSILTRIRRDGMGRDTMRIKANGADTVRIRTTYNSLGDELRVATYATGMPDSIYTWKTYNKRGWVLKQYVAGETDSLVYDQVGNITARVRQSAGPVTISMEYDAMNRLVKRIVPQVTYATTFGVIDSLPFYDPSLTIPVDTSVFTYNTQDGMLATAYNKYARIKRTYTPDGLVERDSMAFRAWDADTYSYKNVIVNTYDKSRRRTTITHPTWLLNGSPGSTQYWFQRNTGFVDSIADPDGNKYYYTYDAFDRPRVSRFAGGGRDSLTYDTDGKVIETDFETNDAALDTIFDWDVVYDDAGQLLTMTNHSAGDTLNYDNLGRPSSGAFTQWYSQQQEELTRDGLGNPLTHLLNPYASPVDGSTTDYAWRKYLYGYDAHRAVTSRIEVWNQGAYYAQPTGWYGDTIKYSGGKNRNSSYSREPLWQFDTINGTATATLLATRREESKSYYDANEVLRMHQVNRDSTRVVGGVTQDSVAWHWGTYEEYRYDAFGRRVIKHIKEVVSLNHCKMVTRCQPSTTRFTWDGNQILYETRRDDTSPTQTYIASDTTGQVIYVYKDAGSGPIGIVRNTATMVIHRPPRRPRPSSQTSSFRSTVAFVTNEDGEHATCVEQPGGCDPGLLDVNFPAFNSGLEGRSEGTDADREVNTPDGWIGSLVAEEYRSQQASDPPVAVLRQNPIATERWSLGALPARRTSPRSAAPRVGLGTSPNPPVAMAMSAQCYYGSPLNECRDDGQGEEDARDPLNIPGAREGTAGGSDTGSSTGGGSTHSAGLTIDWERYVCAFILGSALVNALERGGAIAVWGANAAWNQALGDTLFGMITGPSSVLAAVWVTDTNQDDEALRRRFEEECSGMSDLGAW